MLTASVRPRLSALTFRSGLLVELAFFRNGKPIYLFEDQLPDRHVLPEHKRDWSEVNDLQGDRPGTDRYLPSRRSTEWVSNGESWPTSRYRGDGSGVMTIRLRSRAS